MGLAMYTLESIRSCWIIPQTGPPAQQVGCFSDSDGRRIENVDGKPGIGFCVTGQFNSRRFSSLFKNAQHWTLKFYSNGGVHKFGISKLVIGESYIEMNDWGVAYLCQETSNSTILANGLALQSDANNCPCNTTWTLRRRAFSSSAMRLWRSTARSEQGVLRRKTSCPAKFQHVSSATSSSTTKSSWNTLSLPDGPWSQMQRQLEGAILKSSSHDFRDGIWHWPKFFSPQPTARPSPWRSTVWKPPAETWTYDIPKKQGVKNQLQIVVYWYRTLN